jgi:hypothetical protein
MGEWLTPSIAQLVESLAPSRFLLRDGWLFNYEIVDSSDLCSQRSKMQPIRRLSLVGWVGGTITPSVDHDIKQPLRQSMMAGVMCFLDKHFLGHTSHRPAVFGKPESVGGHFAVNIGQH